MISRASLALVSALLVLAVAAAPATAAPDLVGSRSLAMGGALRAAPSGETAVLLNPAGLSLGKTYMIGALYQFRASDKASQINVSVVDSVTTRVAAGIFYNFAHAAPEYTLALGGGKTFPMKETLANHEGGLAMSYPIGDVFHLGVTSKYVYHSVDQPGDTPDAAKREGAKGFTMDIGGVARLGGLNLALVGYNLLLVDRVMYPRLLGMGVSYALGTTFLAEFDTVLNLTAADAIKPSYHGGAEFFLGGSYALRGGVMHDTLRQATYATFGAGLISSVIGIDFGMRQMVAGGSETMISVSVRVFLNN